MFTQNELFSPSGKDILTRIFSIELKFSGFVVLSTFCGISIELFHAVHSVEVIYLTKIGTYARFYRKIHYLTREFRVKLHAKTDIARIAKRITNREAMSAISVFESGNEFSLNRIIE